jgi:hypothetical protein
VCPLKKSLFGLKQVAWAWYEKINRLFLNLTFKCYELVDIIYVQHVIYDMLIIELYVDVLVITNGSDNFILSLKKRLTYSFHQMIDFFLLHFF